jgi:hypothetical protein
MVISLTNLLLVVWILRWSVWVGPVISRRGENILLNLNDNFNLMIRKCLMLATEENSLAFRQPFARFHNGVFLWKFVSRGISMKDFVVFKGSCL